MKCFDTIKDKIFGRDMLDYPSSDGVVITCQCPYCKEYVDIDYPADGPPTGNHKTEGFCVWCGKRFVFFY